MIGKMKYRMNTERKSSRKAAESGRGVFSQARQREESRQSESGAESRHAKKAETGWPGAKGAGHAKESGYAKESRRPKAEYGWPGAKESGYEKEGRHAKKARAEWPGGKESRKEKSKGLSWIKSGAASEKGRESSSFFKDRDFKDKNFKDRGFKDKDKTRKKRTDAQYEQADTGRKGTGREYAGDAAQNRYAAAENHASQTGTFADKSNGSQTGTYADRFNGSQTGTYADRYNGSQTGTYADRYNTARTGYEAGNMQPPYDMQFSPKAEEDAALPKIEGRNAVLEAFRAGKTIDKLFVLDGCKDGPVQTILREAKKQDTVIHFVDKDRLNKMSETRKHQGVIAVSAAYEYASVEDILAKAQEKGEEPFLILLDNIEDPHNLGAIIRTANLAGAHGVIIPKRRAVGLTGTVAKASAGAVSYTPVAKVTNLSQTIRELKERGIWFVCADMEGEVMYRQNLTGPLGLVIGGEGDGVSRLVKENCDFAASIPMKGEIDSLNASAAAAVLSYEIVRQRTLKA